MVQSVLKSLQTNIEFKIFNRFLQNTYLRKKKIIHFIRRKTLTAKHVHDPYFVIRIVITIRVSANVNVICVNISAKS